MKKNKYYITTMYRAGSKERHSYVVGCFNSKHKAIKEGKKEETYRGDKYTCEVIEVDMNQSIAETHEWHKVVHELRIPEWAK